MRGSMKGFLLFVYLLSLAIESRSRVLTYDWNRKWYYCGRVLTDIMEQACVRRPNDHIPHNRIKRKIGIATRCCKTAEERIDPEIDGCSINDMLEDYCDHPERADRSKPLKIIENGGIRSATDPFKDMEMTTPRVTTTSTTTTTRATVVGSKRLPCIRIFLDGKIMSNTC